MSRGPSGGGGGGAAGPGRASAKVGAGAAAEGLGGGAVTRRRFRGPALGGDGPQLRGGVAAMGFLGRLRGLRGGGVWFLGEGSWSPGTHPWVLQTVGHEVASGRSSPTFTDALSGTQCSLFPPTPHPLFFPLCMEKFPLGRLS